MKYPKLVVDNTKLFSLEAKRLDEQMILINRKLKIQQEIKALRVEDKMLGDRILVIEKTLDRIEKRLGGQNGEQDNPTKTTE